ncbi:MAG: radical SAM protein [Syntrophaceae bacterium]
MKYPLTTLYSGYIERIPFFHFYPGSRVLSIGTYGCNLDCKYCSNQHLLNEPAFFFDLSPEQVASKALTAGCPIISFSANEPAVSFEYFMDIVHAAREKGILVGCSTNGLLSDSQTAELARSVSCVNISIKGPTQDYYRTMCGKGNPQKVLETIRTLYDHGVHVEVVTPYVPLLTESDMADIACMLSQVSPHIPWHIFRLLPEYKLASIAATGVQDMVALRSVAGKVLDYIYLENFPASIWVDTLCPSCKTPLIKRISNGGCGATLLEHALEGGMSCPSCSRQVHLKGTFVLESQTQEPAQDPRTGIIDVGGWRSEVDMATCLPTKASGRGLMTEFIEKNPYPGDMKKEADTWVTDTAVAAARKYRPDLMVLVYSQCAFVGRHREEDSLYSGILENLTSEVDRFLMLTGYDSLIVGLGDMVATRGTINLEKHIKGIASADDGIACLYGADQEDADTVRGLEGIHRILTRCELEELAGVTLDKGTFGEYFVVPEEGYRFLALSSPSRFSYRTEAMDRVIPVCATFTPPSRITDIRRAVVSHVLSGHNTALIILDGVGVRSFPFEAAPVDNTFGGIPYASSMHQYMVLSSGRKIVPHFFAYPHWISSPRINPFSRNSPFLSDCLTFDVLKAGRVPVAIGNRSIMTHTAFPSKITIECQSLALHHYGILETVL